MMLFAISLLLLSSLPISRSNYFKTEDWSINEEFAKDFVDRLNDFYNKANEEISAPNVMNTNPHQTQAKTITEFLYGFARNMKISGVKHLKNVALTIHKIMKKQSEDSSLHGNDDLNKHSIIFNEYPQEIVKDYKNAIKRLYEYTVEHYIKKFDQKSVLLNFVEEANEELFTKKTLLLKHYLVYVNGKMSPNWPKISEIINFDYKEQKHIYLQELCYKREICRPYPGFTDFMSDLIEDVIALPAGKFHRFMQTIIPLIVEKRDFFESIMQEKDFGAFSTIVDCLDKGDYNSVKHSLHQVSNFIKKKFKLLKTTDKMLKTQTKAIRLLMQIVDKVFEKDGQELMRITFGNLRSALKASAQENITDLKKMFSDFIKHSLNLCESQWGQDSREEVKTLVEAALKGSSLINPELLRDLFEFGSEFLQRDPVDLYML